MARLSTRPTGTVTFLFTDIEGSTRMWDERPDAMTGALTRHDEMMRSVIERHSGLIFKHTGDGICAAFQSPSDALEAGLAVQAAFREEVFESIGQISVRVALHTGEAEERQDDYRGPALNRVSRLLDVAVGGDILLTDTAEENIRATLPADVELADLGEHRLRGISEPGHVYYVELPGREPPGHSAAPWLAAIAATVLVAGAIAVFSLASPPGTGTPEPTIEDAPPTTVPIVPTTVAPVGEPLPGWVVDPGGPVVALTAHDGVVLAGSQSTGLHAYSVADAAPVWADQGLVVDVDKTLIEPFGAPVKGTPVVSGGLVFYSTLLGTLHAVDGETGALRWWHGFERCLGGDCAPVVPSQPSVRDDVVLVAAGSDLYLFAASTGEFESVDGGFGSASAGPTFGGDFVYVAEGPSVFQYNAADLSFVQTLFVGDDLPVGYRSGVTSFLTPVMPSEFGLGSDHGIFVADAEGFLSRRSLTTGSVHPAWIGEAGAPNSVEVATVPVAGPGLNDRAVPVLWSVDSTGLLRGIDAGSGRTVRNVHVGPTTHSVALGDNGIVFVATDSPELVGYDPSTETVVFRQPLSAVPNADPVVVAGVVMVAGVDGTIRAYTSDGEVELDGPVPTGPSIEGSVQGVAWSSTGDLAFVHRGDVWVLAEHFGEPVNLTRLTGGGSAPAWSPDGVWLAYISGSVGRDIYLIRPDGTGRRNLTVTPGSDESAPSWSADGSRIVFGAQACADQGGQQPGRVCLTVSDLYSVDLAGQIRPLIDNPATVASDREPDWSAAGNQIAFTSDRSVGGLPIGAEWHLWTMSTAGADLAPLRGQEAVVGRSPAFSPDGNRLAFISGGGRAGVEALFVFDLETGTKTRLLDLPIGAGAPAWSPDGTRLAFTWVGSALGRIFTVSATSD